MDKLISQLTGSGANLQDTDVCEGQKAGELVTKKFTGAQMRAVEKAERQLQDDTIEAGAGLNANGTFTSPADSWFLRAVDFAAGCTDRAGATGALVENIYNALRLLDAKSATGSGTTTILKAAVSADVTWGAVIPAGYMLEHVVVQETSGNDPILSLGITPGGNEVFINQAMLTNDMTNVFIGRCFSMAANTTLYLNDATAGDTWDGATISVYLCLRSMIPGIMGTGTSIISYYVGAYGFAGAVLTEAEIVSVTGAASGYAAGSTAFINDTVGYKWIVFTDGVSWYHGETYFKQAL